MRIALGLDVSPAASFATVVSVREAAAGSPKPRVPAGEFRPLRRDERLAPKSMRIASIVDATRAAISATTDQFAPPESIAIAYPMHWEDDTVVRLRRALRLAQLRDVVVVSAAVAAAAGTDGRHPLGDGSSVVVVEFGPGSARVQAVRKIDGTWHPAGESLTIAEPRVGGAEAWSSRLFAALRGPRMPDGAERVILIASGTPMPNVLPSLAPRVSMPIVSGGEDAGSSGAATVAAIAAGFPIATAPGSPVEPTVPDARRKRLWAWPFGDGTLTMNQLWPITLAAALFVALVGASGGVLNSAVVGSRHPTPTPSSSSGVVAPVVPATASTDTASAEPQTTSAPTAPAASTVLPSVPRKKSGSQTGPGPAPVTPPGGAGPLPTTAPDPTSSPTDTGSPSPTPSDTATPSPTSTDPPPGP